MTALVTLVLLASPGFGPADSVASVRFEGNRSFRGRTLAAAVSVRPGQPLIERQLDTDARLLAVIYADNGFRSAEVAWDVRPAQRHWMVVFTIGEGIRSRVARVRFEGNFAWDSTRLAGLVTAQPGRHLSAAMLGDGESRLTMFYNDNGYPFALVSGEWEHNDTLSVLTYRIEEGPRCYVSAIRVRGNRRVATSVALRTLELEPGELFRRRRLQEAQRRLYATRLFQRVLFYVLKPDGEPLSPFMADLDHTLPQEEDISVREIDSVVIRYDVVEQAHRGFAFGFGFETPPFRLLGSVDWQHFNAFGRGHVLETGLEYSPDFAGDYRLGLRAGYRVPYFLGDRTEFLFRPFGHLERADTILNREYGAETGVSRSLVPQLSVGLSNRLRLVADTASGITNAVGLNLQLDTRDDAFDPTRGVYLRPLAEIAGGVLMGTNDFYRLSGELRCFLSLGRDAVANDHSARFVLAIRGLAGAAFPYGSSEGIPYYEAFTLGGRNNLRGYPDRSLGPDSTGPRARGGYRFGPMILNASVELRSPYILNWVGLVAFADGGEVVGHDSGFTADDFEYSAGVGLRVRTPIGPVRLDWGKQLREPPPGDRGRFYFGLLHAF